MLALANCVHVLIGWWVFDVIFLAYCIGIVCIVFMLSAISPCTTGLKALYDPSEVLSNSQITDIPLTERQRLKDDHLSMSLRFFNLPLGIGPNDRGPPF